MGIMSGFEKFFVNRSSVRTARKFVELMEQSGTTLQRGKGRILELGAGSGALSYSLYTKLGPERLVVTDFDYLQVQAAVSYFKKRLGAIPENVEIREGDAMKLPFPAESFDAVVASHVLHHVEKREWHFESIPTALGEIDRVVKTGGYFIFEEIFNKKKVKGSLVSLGFAELFEKSPWPGDGFYVFRKKITSTQKDEFRSGAS